MSDKKRNLENVEKKLGEEDVCAESQESSAKDHDSHQSSTSSSVLAEESLSSPVKPKTSPSVTRKRRTLAEPEKIGKDESSRKAKVPRLLFQNVDSSNGHKSENAVPKAADVCDDNTPEDVDLLTFGKASNLEHDVGETNSGCDKKTVPSISCSDVVQKMDTASESEDLAVISDEPSSHDKVQEMGPVQSDTDLCDNIKLESLRVTSSDEVPKETALNIVIDTCDNEELDTKSDLASSSDKVTKIKDGPDLTVAEVSVNIQQEIKEVCTSTRETTVKHDSEDCEDDKVPSLKSVPDIIDGCADESSGDTNVKTSKCSSVDRTSEVERDREGSDTGSNSKRYLGSTAHNGVPQVEADSSVNKEFNSDDDADDVVILEMSVAGNAVASKLCPSETVTVSKEASIYLSDAEESEEDTDELDSNDSGDESENLELNSGDIVSCRYEESDSRETIIILGAEVSDGEDAGQQCSSRRPVIMNDKSDSLGIAGKRAGSTGCDTDDDDEVVILEERIRNIVCNKKFDASELESFSGETDASAIKQKPLVDESTEDTTDDNEGAEANVDETDECSTSESSEEVILLGVRSTRKGKIEKLHSSRIESTRRKKSGQKVGKAKRSKSKDDEPTETKKEPTEINEPDIVGADKDESSVDNTLRSEVAEGKLVRETEPSPSRRSSQNDSASPGESVVGTPLVDVLGAPCPYVQHKEEPMYTDPRLPSGWVRSVVQRKKGATAGKYDVYIISPEGKKFRSRVQLNRFLIEIGLHLSADTFDFSVNGKGVKVKEQGETSGATCIINTDSGMIDEKRVQNETPPESDCGNSQVNAKDLCVKTVPDINILEVPKSEGAEKLTLPFSPSSSETSESLRISRRVTSSYFAGCGVSKRISKALHDSGFKDEVEKVQNSSLVQAEPTFVHRRICNGETERDLSPQPDDKIQVNVSDLVYKTGPYDNNLLKRNLMKKWTPPRSPFNLVQEHLYHDPWQLLVATIFLNRTQGEVALPSLFKFFATWPTPESVINAKQADIAQFLQPLGLQETRSYAIQRMSPNFGLLPFDLCGNNACWWPERFYRQAESSRLGPLMQHISHTRDYVTKKWKNAKELFGIGTYGNDSYKIFCVNQWKSVRPTDVKLKDYVNWLWTNHRSLGLS